VNFFLLVDSGGHRVAGNGDVRTGPAVNDYVVAFPRSVAECALVASPARVPGGLVPDPPAGSTVIVGHDADGNAFVRTFNQDNQPDGLPFALIAAC
jgi:hypothetical protein